jgi:hypothetical protein
MHFGRKYYLLSAGASVDSMIEVLGDVELKVKANYSQATDKKTEKRMNEVVDRLSY